ncbi:hypothetical protein ABNQ38_27620 [Azospirillum sp. A29]|jgi:hypothetical protein|uniref:hypothetical protein n=1 Tax=Azospirillum sp. A29 TaxID=3160606 RepID=UPI003671EB34
MQPNRHILIHLDGRRPTRTVAVSLERCAVMIHCYTPEGFYDSSEVLNRPPTPIEARDALCQAYLSDQFAGLLPEDRADVLWRLALIAAGDAQPGE